MMKCAQCQATLPDGSGFCQFCGNTWAVARQPESFGIKTPPVGQTFAWVWPAYYLISGLWIIDGLRTLLYTANMIPKLAAVGAFGTSFGILGGLIGLATMAIGIALILRMEWARGILNILCFLQILDGIFSFATSILIINFLGTFGIVLTIVSAIRVVIAGLMIFLIGETDRSTSYT